MVSYVVGNFKTRYLLEWYLIDWDLLVWGLMVRDLLSCNHNSPCTDWIALSQTYINASANNFRIFGTSFLAPRDRLLR